MRIFTFNPQVHAYVKETNTFMVNERDVPFDTSYTIKNSVTGNSMEFEFTHSTGPEFEPSTKWIYKSADGCILEVCNDPEMTEIARKNYLRAKLGNAI